MKVFITGMGVLSSLGNSVDDMYKGLLEGRTGVRQFPEWKQHKGLHSHLGAPVPEFETSAISRTARRTMSKMSEMATLATHQALSQADLRTEDLDSNRTLLCMGSTTGSPATLETYFKKLFEKGGPEGQLSTSFFKAMNHSVVSNVAVGIGYSGPVLGMASACSTSAQAMIIGWELIRGGFYDVVIAGGADELHYTSAAVFDIVLAASRGYYDTPELSPRPFDIKRDGLVCSEGAGIVVMESEGHARRRGALPLAEFLGGAYLCDGTHMSQPQASAMVDVMNLALVRSESKSDQIGYINAHATGTMIGDAEEAKATGEVFGDRVPTSSLKGHLGHSLAACGAIELAACVRMMHSAKLIPTRNLEVVDPQCSQIKHIYEVERSPVSKILSNNFAFGGMNTSLVISLPGFS